MSPILRSSNFFAGTTKNALGSKLVMVSVFILADFPHFSVAIMLHDAPKYRPNPAAPWLNARLDVVSWFSAPNITASTDVPMTMRLI